ncbi:MAG: hypothetical protein ACXADY_22975 [Candidatus Hodarchaeales archaeon]
MSLLKRPLYYLKVQLESDEGYQAAIDAEKWLQNPDDFRFTP